LIAVLGGCHSAAEPSLPVDVVLENQTRSGHTAMALDRPAQAVSAFKQALARARVRDDAEAIGDVGFNLAVAQLQSGRPSQALATSREVEAELARRGAPSIPALRLVEAVSLYRLSQPELADPAAAEVERGTDPASAARAAFLRGLIADDRGDAPALAVALQKVNVAKGGEHKADATELTARLALRSGDPARAQREAELAAELRRDLLDYRALARCLALAARAAEQGNQAVAADLYLRAGRTAGAEVDKAAARRWLDRAISLSRDPELTRAAKAALAASNQQD